MTQEEKDLLLRDLCARLPYGVKYQTYLGDTFSLKDITLSRTTSQYYIDDNAFSLKQIKPYLRPMSSMTEEEKVEIQDLYHKNTQEVFKDPSEIRGYRFYDISVVDWLNEHHFDYRGLIEKGLALEAPEGMYKI